MKLIRLIILAPIILLVAFVVMLWGLGYFLSPQSKLAKSDAIVAVSGGDTTARAEEAIKLYRLGWAPHIIFSGAALDPNSPSNAQAMKRIAISEGVPAASILLDEVSLNTTENALSVADIVKANNFDQIILVTSPYHQRRASMEFASRLPDTKILNHSAPDQRWRRSHWWATGYSTALTLSELQKVLYVWWSGA